MEKFLPMLLHSAPPFDDDNYIFEVKFDGIRCIAYLTKQGAVLTNRHGGDITAKFPELSLINRCCNFDCVLDGEIVALKDGKPDLYRLLQRGKNNKAEFVAFDILQLNGVSLINTPLKERKKILAQSVLAGNNLTVLDFVEKGGIALFNLIKQKGLEGIVAKNKDSLYYPAKRTRQWLKIKVRHEEEFDVAGYIYKDGQPKQIILSQGGRYAGAINIASHTSAQKQLTDFLAEHGHAPRLFKDIKNAVWLKDGLFCKVEYLQKMPSGGLRHHAFKGVFKKE